jgi:hypothetical protein
VDAVATATRTTRAARAVAVAAATGFCMLRTTFLAPPPSPGALPDLGAFHPVVDDIKT